jgi:hypothetical protein
MLIDPILEHRKNRRQPKPTSYLDIAERREAKANRRRIIDAMSGRGISAVRWQWMDRCRYVRIFMTDPECVAFHKQEGGPAYPDQHKTLVHLLRSTRNEASRLPS